MLGFGMELGDANLFTCALPTLHERRHSSYEHLSRRRTSGTGCDLTSIWEQKKDEGLTTHPSANSRERLAKRTLLPHEEEEAVHP